MLNVHAYIYIYIIMFVSSLVDHNLFPDSAALDQRENSSKLATLADSAENSANEQLADSTECSVSEQLATLADSPEISAANSSLILRSLLFYFSDSLRVGTPAPNSPTKSPPP